MAESREPRIGQNHSGGIGTGDLERKRKNDGCHPMPMPRSLVNNVKELMELFVKELMILLTRCRIRPAYASLVSYQ